MPYKETENCAKSKIQNKDENTDKNVESLNNVTTQEKRTVYCVKLNKATCDDKVLLSFDKNDISEAVKDHRNEGSST